MLGAMIAIIIPLFRRPQGDDVSSAAIEMALLQDHYRRHRDSLAVGTTATTDPYGVELGRRLLAAEASAPDRVAIAAAGTSRRLIVILVAIIGLAIAVLAYRQAGSPDLIAPHPSLSTGSTELAADSEFAALMARAEQHLAANPDESIGWRRLAPIYLRLEDFDKASKAWHHVLRLEGENANIRLILGQLVLTATAANTTQQPITHAINMKTAQGHLTRAINLGEKTGAAHYFLGIIAFDEGRRDDAANLWRTALQHADHHDSDPPFWHAIAKQSLGRLDRENKPPQ